MKISWWSPAALCIHGMGRCSIVKNDTSPVVARVRLIAYDRTETLLLSTRIVCETRHVASGETPEKKRKKIGTLRPANRSTFKEPFAKLFGINRALVASSLFGNDNYVPQI